MLCVGGRTPLDEAAGRMLAGVLQRQGLKARALPSDAISAAHIVSLEASKTKLVCLSYLGAGANAAHVRYLVRRLRRILPEGATVLVGFWAMKEVAPGSRLWKRPPKPMPMSPR